MKQRSTEETTFYMDYLEAHGLTHEQALTALELDSICRIDSARRAYNDIKEVKDRKTQEQMRQKYSPNPVARDTRSYRNQYLLDV